MVSMVEKRGARPASATIEREIWRWVDKIEKETARVGLVALPRFNLGATQVSRGTEDLLRYASVFGWTGKEASWHQLAEQRACPLAEVCRHQIGPFWSAASSTVHTRWPTPYLDRIDLAGLWEKTKVRAILTVPVHMRHAQVGLVHFVTGDDEIKFESAIDKLSFYSRELVMTYARYRDVEKDVSCSEQLSSHEIDCLYWAFLGKTDREIAEITDRSYSTIRFYMSNAAVKLNTVNRAQTLAKAAVLGYFEVIN